MKRYKIDRNTKMIVKGLMAKERERKRRRRRHQLTEFDKLVDEATKKADGMASTEGFCREARDIVISGIHKSLGEGVPWEKLDDVYVGRRFFYELRTEYMYNVAVELGLIRED